jgi:parallel beta-helix repeat protein
MLLEAHLAGRKALVVGAVAVVALASGPTAGPRTEDAHGKGGRSSAAHARKRSPAPRRRRPAPLSKASAFHCDRVAAPWGHSRAPGTASRPVRGPWGLVRVLRSGQTGCLRAGTYRQRQTDVTRPHVTVRSWPGEVATWRGRVVLQGRGDRLIGLKLDGSAGPRCSTRGCGALPSPTINAADVVVADNDITSPGSGICVHPRAWRGKTPDRFQILGNRIHDCGRRPPTDHDHGIYVADGRGGVIRDNVVFRNADRGIQLYPEARGTLVAYNTVDGNGSGVIFSERSSYNRVENNVFTNSVVRWNAETFNLRGSGNRFQGNCVRAGNPNPDYNDHAGVALPRAVSQQANRVARGSVYVDRSAGDLRLQSGSVCAGKGAADSVAAPHGAP